MAAVAPPWPSQRRAPSNSERHAAMARMRERRGGARGEDRWADDEPPPRPPPSARPPREPASRPRSGVGLGSTGSLSATGGSDAPPWAPAWDPQASPRKALSMTPSHHDDLDEPPPAPRCPAPPSGPPSGRPSSRGRVAASAPAPAPAAPPPPSASSRSAGMASNRCGGGLEDERNLSAPRERTRVRGPAEVRASRATAEDEDIPAGAAGADFKTLQQMIARGIQDSEKGDLPEPDIREDDADLQRHREDVRRRREEEAKSREREREAARQRRRREEEQRQRRQAEELEKEFEAENVQRREREAVEAQCRREMCAASRIQARMRGRRSRQGKLVHTPFVKRELHTEPWVQSAPKGVHRSTSMADALDDELS